MDASAIKVKQGDEILPAWRKLVAWVETLRVIKTPGSRLLVTPRGTRVYMEDGATSWPHPFKVRVQGRDATVGVGRVNNRIPAIGDKLLDGVRFGEEDTGEPGDAPTIKLKGKRFGCTWLAIVARTSAGVINPQDAAALTVAEVQTLSGALLEGGAPDEAGVGVWPIAALYWRNGELDRRNQIAMHNLAHRFQDGGTAARGRHFFWAA